VTGNMRPRGRRGPFVRPRERGSRDVRSMNTGAGGAGGGGNSSPTPRPSHARAEGRGLSAHDAGSNPSSPRLPPAPRTTGRGSSPPGEPHHAQPWKGGG